MAMTREELEERGFDSAYINAYLAGVAAVDDADDLHRWELTDRLTYGYSCDTDDDDEDDDDEDGDEDGEDGIWTSPDVPGSSEIDDQDLPDARLLGTQQGFVKLSRRTAGFQEVQGGWIDARPSGNVQAEDEIIVAEGRRAPVARQIVGVPVDMLDPSLRIVRRVRTTPEAPRHGRFVTVGERLQPYDLWTVGDTQMTWPPFAGQNLNEEAYGFVVRPR